MRGPLGSDGTERDTLLTALANPYSTLLQPHRPRVDDPLSAPSGRTGSVAPARPVGPATAAGALPPAAPVTVTDWFAEVLATHR